MPDAQDIKRGEWIILNNELYNVTRKELVAYGTHSHSKTKLFVIPLVGKGEKSVTFAHRDRIETADITKKTAQVISKLPDKIQIMDIKTYETFDADVDNELLNNVNEGDEVIFIEHNGMIKVLEKK
jgi:translation initiation factor 5A